MQTTRKSKTTLKAFSPAQVAAAKAAATPKGAPNAIDWQRGAATRGGGVAATISALRKARGRNKNPTKEQVAIRLDPDVLAAFRANGPGWQTRMNGILKEWLTKNQPAPRRRRVAHADA